MNLQGKIAALFIAVAFLVGGPLLWTVRQSASRIDLDELGKKGALVALDLADRVVDEFQSAREVSLLPLLQAAQEKSGAVYVAAIDSKGRILAHTNVAETGKIYRDANTVVDLKLLIPDHHLALYQGIPIIEVAAPVWIRSGVIASEDFLFSGTAEPKLKTRLGVVRLGLPLDEIRRRESRLFRRIAVIILLAGGAGLLLIFFSMRRMLRPIQWLSSGTMQVARGEYGISVPVRSEDELGELAKRFNHMSRILSETTVSKNYLGDILSHMVDPLIVMTMDGVIRMANQATLELLGYTKEELEGRNARLLFFGKEAAPDGADQEILIARGTARNLELSFRTKSGAQVPVLFSNSVLMDMAGQPSGIIAVAKDMTERKRLENVIRQSEKMSAVGQLAAGVAHEINNPLGVILGFAQASVRRLQPEDPLELPLKSIEREAIRCKNLVQDLLTFSRVSKIDREPLEINRAIEGAFSLVNAQARMTHVELRKDLAPGLPRILGNLNQIQQVIINLVSNALDALGDKAGQITVKTECAKDGMLSWVCVKITDNGPGIRPEIQDRIFEPFFTTKPVGKGTGLGLSLVHEIIKKHSGSIDLQSRPGFTEFCIKLPVNPTAGSFTAQVSREQRA